MTWDSESDETLRTLWLTSLPAAAIGERLGKNKNAVIGRAHRLGLQGKPRAERSDKVRKVSLPVVPFWTPDQDNRLRHMWIVEKLTTRVIAELLGKGSTTIQRRVERLGLPRRLPGKRKASDTVRAPVRTGRGGPIVTKDYDAAAWKPGCQWIDGTPSASDACKCLAERVPGSPYCEPHSRRAWTRAA